MGLDRSCGNCASPLEELPNYFPHQLHVALYVPAVCKSSNASTSSPTLVLICLFFIIAMLMSMDWHIIVVLICISPVAIDVEHLFMGFYYFF